MKILQGRPNVVVQTALDGLPILQLLFFLNFKVYNLIICQNNESWFDRVTALQQQTGLRFWPTLYIAYSE